MRYPYINSRPKRALEIPDMVGGINLRDGISNIADNQLTDGLNVYDKDGRLRTRSGYKILDNIPKNITEDFPGQGERTLYYGGHSVIGKYKSGVIISVYRATDDEYAPRVREYLYFLSEKGQIKYLDYVHINFEDNPEVHIFTVKDNYLYDIASTGYGTESVYTYTSAYKLDLEAGTPAFAETNIYIPTILIGYKETNGGIGYEATQFEGFSILTDKFIIRGQTINLDDSTHPGVFKLPYKLKKSSTLTVRTSGAKGATRWTNTHTLTVAASGTSTESGTPSDGKRLTLNSARDTIIFYRTEAGHTSEIFQFGTDYYYPDNMEIQGEREANATSIELRQAVFDCQSQVWYGGTANGITSGSRLFLGGATAPKYRNMIFWSGLNDATALLENCYAAVGDKSTGVTGFGQQGENLIIFKESSTHYTQTQYNNDITAEQLINQQIVDYSANAVYYPIIDISGDIGCDLPDTVKLCNNRLIWANRNGKVYTLTNANQYSQMNIYELSAMIEPETAAKRIVGGNAVRYDGYYMLQYMINDNSQTVPDSVAYLLRLESDGVRYVTYGKVKNKELKTAWFKFSIDGNMLNTDDAYGNIPALYMTEGSNHLFFYGFSQNDYDEIPDESGQELTTEHREIDCFLLTKAFDFGLPNYRKFISDINITAGNNGGVPIGVTFKTDEGEEETEIIPVGAETEDRAVSYYDSYHLMPGLKGYCRLSIELRSNGIIDVDKISLIYRLLGGVK